MFYSRYSKQWVPEFPFICVHVSMQHFKSRTQMILQIWAHLHILCNIMLKFCIQFLQQDITFISRIVHTDFTEAAKKLYLFSCKLTGYFPNMNIQRCSRHPSWTCFECLITYLSLNRPTTSWCASVLYRECTSWNRKSVWRRSSANSDTYKIITHGTIQFVPCYVTLSINTASQAGFWLCLLRQSNIPNIALKTYFSHQDFSVWSHIFLSD